MIPSHPMPAIDLTSAPVRRLERGEQLVLWSLRAMALGHAECPVLRRAFHVALGASADEAFAALFVAVRTLGWCARRRIRLHMPGCEKVSADERLILNLLALAQHSAANGEEDAIRHRVTSLIDPTASEGLLMSLQAAACALELAGHRLPVREDLEPPVRPRVLH